jgi:hypothetical protein
MLWSVMGENGAKNAAGAGNAPSRIEVSRECGTRDKVAARTDVDEARAYG